VRDVIDPATGPTGAPQWAQKALLPWTGWPHLPQVRATNGVPQLLQNRPDVLALQAGHSTMVSVMTPVLGARIGNMKIIDQQ
jgi:hypothetical protein